MNAASNERCDLALVGTGFATSFFLHEALTHLPPTARVVVLERGDKHAHRDQLRGRRGPGSNRLFENRAREQKRWNFSIAFGGGSNCWWACTPRMLPEDFELHRRYGVGVDWPITYDELEPYYARAEALMDVSGPSDSPFPRSTPYPQPAHRMSDVDKALKAAFPDAFFHQPCARPSRPTASGRPPCCGSGVCGLCPIDSKFTIQNGMHAVYADPRVRVVTGADVQRVECEAGRARTVVYRDPDGAERSVDADFVGLGANALFNPFILRRSGFDDPALGRGLGEQASVDAVVRLDGLENFQGSTVMTGHGYHAYAGDHRRTRAACLVETWNSPLHHIRDERGKWRMVLPLKLVFEDLRRDDNRVETATDGERPVAIYEGRSRYAQAGIDHAATIVADLVRSLPVERVDISRPNTTESHIMGTTVMGDDPATSVVDHALVHHRVRNLAILGSGAFPTAAPANPTLTLSALALRSAAHVFGRGDHRGKGTPR